MGSENKADQASALVSSWLCEGVEEEWADMRSKLSGECTAAQELGGQLRVGLHAADGQQAGKAYKTVHFIDRSGSVAAGPARSRPGVPHAPASSRAKNRQ